MGKKIQSMYKEIQSMNDEIHSTCKEILFMNKELNPSDEKLHLMKNEPHPSDEECRLMNKEFHSAHSQYEDIIQEYGEYIEAALSKETWSSYRKSWRIFERFCESKGYQAFPTSPKALVDFAVTRATEPKKHSSDPLSMNSLDLYLKAIHYKNKYLGFDSPYHNPVVDLILSGLRRTHGSAGRRRKTRPLLAHEVEKMIDACSDTLIGKRNAALIALCFAGALRQSDIRNACVGDIELVEKRDPTDPDRIFLHIFQSKTDQEGEGQRVPILQGKNIQPLKHLKRWLRASGINSGCLFQTMGKGGVLRGNPLDRKDISRVLKHHAKLIGLDPTRISSHSLRVGFVTSAVINGAREDKIRAITRHTSQASLAIYIRDVDDFKDHAGEGIL